MHALRIDIQSNRKAGHLLPAAARLGGGMNFPLLDGARHPLVAAELGTSTTIAARPRGVRGFLAGLARGTYFGKAYQCVQ